eukprot:347417-Chlamydomonas_euryale.AAC.11
MLKRSVPVASAALREQRLLRPAACRVLLPCASSACCALLNVESCCPARVVPATPCCMLHLVALCRYSLSLAASLTPPPGTPRVPGPPLELPGAAWHAPRPIPTPRWASRCQASRAQPTSPCAPSPAQCTCDGSRRAEAMARGHVARGLGDSRPWLAVHSSNNSSIQIHELMPCGHLAGLGTAGPGSQSAIHPCVRWCACPSVHPLLRKTFHGVALTFHGVALTFHGVAHA